MTVKAVCGVLLAPVAIFGLGRLRSLQQRRRRRLQLMPVGITKGSGLTMRRSLRLSRLRELALLDPGGRRI